MTPRRSPWLLLFGVALPQTAAMGAVAVTALLLGPEGRGEIAFVQSLASMIAVVGGWGFYLSAARGNRPVPAQFLFLTLAGGLLVGGAVTAIATIRPSGLLTLGHAGCAGLAGAAVAGTTYLQRTAQAWRGDTDYLRLGAAVAACSAGSIVLATLLGADAGGVVLAWSLAMLVALGVALWMVRGWELVAPSRPLHLLVFVRSGISVGAGNVSTFVLMRADTVALGLVAPASDVGVYSLAVAAAGLLIYVGEIGSLRVIGDFADSSGALHTSAISDRVRQSVRLVALLIPVFAAAGWIVFHYLLPSFSDGFPAFMILCVAAVPASLSRVRLASLSMVGSGRAMRVYSATCILLTLLYLPLAVIGPTGLAAGSLVVYAVQASVLGLLLSRSAGGQH